MIPKQSRYQKVMILIGVWLMILNDWNFISAKKKLHCLINWTQHKKEKDKWHFCLLRGWATFTNVSLMNNKLLIIVILRYRTLIKVNWTKQEQIIGKLRKFWMNQTTIFYGILWFTEYCQKDDWHQYYR